MGKNVFWGIPIVLLLTLTLVEESQAQLTLPPMSGKLTVNATVFHTVTPVEGYPQTEQFTAIGPNFVASLALDASYFLQYPGNDNPAYDLEYTGNLVASGGSQSTSVHLDGMVNLQSGDATSPQTAAAIVEGTLYYYYGVASSPQLPPGTLIPLTVSVQGEASGDEGHGGGRCSILIYEYNDAHSAETDSASTGFSTTWTLWIEPDTANQIRMYGRVAATIYMYNQVGSFGAQFTVDPIFKFDQASFDTLMGENTFPLEDYFTISFSEGVDPIGNTNPIDNTHPIFTSPAIPLLLLDD